MPEDRLFLLLRRLLDPAHVRWERVHGQRQAGAAVAVESGHLDDAIAIVFIADVENGGPREIVRHLREGVLAEIGTVARLVGFALCDVDLALVARPWTGA